MIADAVARIAASWLPADGWAVVGLDSAGEPRVLGKCRLPRQTVAAARAAGGWVLRHALEYRTGHVSDDPVRAMTPDAAALAIPLVCRGRMVAALVGIERGVSVPPTLSPVTRRAVQALLDPAAVALDNAHRMGRAEALSVTDDLTSLYNSRYLKQALRRETKRSVRTGQPLSVLFIDMDGFKNVNDNHGHLCGSRALVEAAGLIRECSRETDVAARFGGDEFAVVLPDTGSDGAVAVAHRVCERIRQHCFLHDEGIDFRLTASVGVATASDAIVTADQLLASADAAMYWVKAHGKDGLQLAVEAAREVSA